MTSEAMLNMLRQMEFTEELTRRQLEILASLGHFMTFSDGETIFREGSKGEFVYLILDGNVAIETHVPGHGRVTY